MVGMVFIILGIVVVMLTSQISKPVNLHEPGPRIFPYLCAAGLILCGTGLLFEKKSEAGALVLTKQGWRKLLSLGVVFVVYAIGIWAIGYFLASVIALWVTIQILSKRKVSAWKAMLISVIFTILVYVIFQYGLHSMLPTGIIFQ